MNRSKWKGFIAKIAKVRNKKKAKQEVAARKSSIIPKFLEQTFSVHNGITFKNITISKEMLGHKFGEFSKTRATFEYKKKKKKKKTKN